MPVVLPNEQLRLEQEVYFANYRLGTSSGVFLGEIKIQRGSDGKFWDGAAFVVTEAWLPTVDGGLLHRYDFTVPSTVDEFYTVSMRPVNDDGAIAVFPIIVRADGPPPHQHVGDFSWDLPIERP